MAKRPPIIMAETDRSGTSLLTKSLEALGLFVGLRRERNHWVDVVHSLQVRREKGLSRLRDRHSRFKTIYWFYQTLKFVQAQRTFVNLRCSSMEEALTMWEEYIQEARSNVSSLKERAMEIKYEDLFEQSVRQLCNKVAHFCELPVYDSDVERVAAKVNDATSALTFAILS